MSIAIATGLATVGLHRAGRQVAKNRGPYAVHFQWPHRWRRRRILGAVRLGPGGDGLLAPADDRAVISGDIADQLAALKDRAGKTIMLSCGPATLAPLASTPGLIDEYLIAVHPAAIGAGPQLLDGLSTDLALRLLEAKVFDSGCLILRYEVVSPR